MAQAARSGNCLVRRWTDHAQPQICALIAAAGVGSRMEAELPKQYLLLAGKTVLQHSIERLAAVEGVGLILVVLHPEDQLFSEKVRGMLAPSVSERLLTVSGGSSRAESVLAGLRVLQQRIESGALNADARVLVHDAARPLVRMESVERLINDVGRENACGGILAIPVSDTMKFSGPNRQIQSTLDRSSVWQAQTPQYFSVMALRDAIDRALSQHRPITDEASAMELAGEAPLLVTGDPDNIKLTHAQDVLLAEMIIQEQLQENVRYAFSVSTVVDDTGVA